MISLPQIVYVSLSGVHEITCDTMLYITQRPPIPENCLPGLANLLRRFWDHNPRVSDNNKKTAVSIYFFPTFFEKGTKLS